jgi:hypothetical protein
MENLAQVLSQEVRKYAGSGWGANLRLFPILDDNNHTYTVIAVDNPRNDKIYSDPDSTGIVVFARIVDNKIVIETDNTDKQLVDALLQQSVPREQIILAYADEPAPDTERKFPVS